MTAMNGKKLGEDTSSPHAFVKCERILFPEFHWGFVSYLALNSQSFGDRLLKTGETALTFSLSSLFRSSRPELGHRLRYLSLRGLSSDRIHFLSEEYYQDVLKPRLMNSGKALLEDLRQQGAIIHLVSTGLASLVQVIANDLGCVDHIHSNRLEFDGRFCTGRLIDPIIGSVPSKDWWKKKISELRNNETAFQGFGSEPADLNFLDLVDKPVTVNPNVEMRSYATVSGWKVLEYKT